MCFGYGISIHMRVILGNFVEDACNYLNIDELIQGWHSGMIITKNSKLEYHLEIYNVRQVILAYSTRIFQNEAIQLISELKLTEYKWHPNSKCSFWRTFKRD